MTQIMIQTKPENDSKMTPKWHMKEVKEEVKEEEKEEEGKEEEEKWEEE